MDKKKIHTVCVIVLIIAIVAVCIVISQSAKQNLEDAQNDLQETYEKYGWVEREKVDILVGKFNEGVLLSSAAPLNLASDDYLTTGEDSYWYGLITGIHLVVVPEEFKNDKTTEDVKYMTIYVEKNSEYFEDSLLYVTHLIRANNNKLTYTEIDKLISDAKEKASSGSSEGAYNGSGIVVGYIEDDDTIQYRVKRMYK